LLGRNVQGQKEKGVISIINLRNQNMVLLKQQDKFYNKKDIPWVKLIWNTYYSEGVVPHATKYKGSFWWSDILKLSEEFRGIAKCKIGDGTIVMFWSDVWNDNLLQHKFPRLYSYAKNKKISMAQFLTHNQVQDQFHLPMSVQVFQEYQQLQLIIQQLQISVETKDSWEYIWGGGGGHPSVASKFYHLPYKHMHPLKPFIWIWDSKCSNKLKVFSWLLMLDKLNVRNILRRKKFKVEGNDYSCPLYANNHEETTFHHFFLCPFSLNCWHHLGINWDFSLGFHNIMEKAKLL
jgi:hypothetical protein